MKKKVIKTLKTVTLFLMGCLVTLVLYPQFYSKKEVNIIDFSSASGMFLSTQKHEMLDLIGSGYKTFPILKLYDVEVNRPNRPSLSYFYRSSTGVMYMTSGNKQFRLEIPFFEKDNNALRFYCFELVYHKYMRCK